MYGRKGKKLGGYIGGILNKRPPTPQFKVKVQSRNITVPSQSLVGLIGAPKFQPWSELWHYPQLKFTINIFTTTRIILIKHQTVVYAYPKYHKSNLARYRCILLL